VRVLDVRKRLLRARPERRRVRRDRRCLARGEQALVFRNRRGYAPVLLCHDCGWRAQCQRCDSPMTVHGAGAACCATTAARARTRPLACPDCGSLGLQPQGFGTERLEEALARASRRALLRVDRGSTSRRGALEARCASSATRPASWSARRCWPRATTCRG
jgi:primosomal protein N' (replication factor Y)